MADDAMVKHDGQEKPEGKRGPMAKAIEPVPDDIIRKARLIYANGLFAGSDDSTTREEECVRIADWLQSHGYEVGATDVLRWRQTGAPDGLLWDDVREGSDGLIRGETYPFGKDGEEQVLRRSVAVAENLLAVSSAALRFTELYDAQGEPVEFLYTVQGTPVPVGGLRPKSFSDVTAGIRAAHTMLESGAKRLTELQEGITDHAKLVSGVATEIMLAINPTFEQLQDLKRMVVTGKVTLDRRPLAEAHQKVAAAAKEIEPIDPSEEGNLDNDFEARMTEARSSIDGLVEAEEAEAPYMQPPELDDEDPEGDTAEGEDEWGEPEDTDDD